MLWMIVFDIIVFVYVKGVEYLFCDFCCDFVVVIVDECIVVIIIVEVI